MNVILQGVVGSTAYGLATPESDIDRLGVFQARTSELLGLHPPKESRVGHNPDITHHELGKFVKLCLANNPTVMELLWLDEYEVMTRRGEDLIAIRDHFLCQRIRKTYGGYATQQKERLKRREEDEPGAGFSSDLKKRTEKHGRHCHRLILQGAWALRHGVLRVRLSESEVDYCRAAGRLAASDVDAFCAMTDEAMEEFDAIESDLPEKPDEAIVERLLLIARTTDIGRVG
jgi:predicted nucleotidyltransferase